ncbi:hypothetical protein HN007_06605 [Candidatus Bathyarchaeota archaeon A05DMB-3]|jgi:hypothetical protein|nr:hypothetical protein [Candidatus Bathyarchaeota archaeon A05DMB-3]
MVRLSGDWREIFYDVLVPTFVAFLIVVVGMLPPHLEGIKYSLLEAIVVVGVPMLIGMIWNKWAGGSAGFIMGSLYGLYFSDQLYAGRGMGDVSLLGNLVSAMLIGYIAGALNKRSNSYRRMLYAGLTSGIMGSLVVLYTSRFSWVLGGITIGGVALTLFPRILAGLLVPLVAKAFLKAQNNKN